MKLSTPDISASTLCTTHVARPEQASPVRTAAQPRAAEASRSDMPSPSCLSCRSPLGGMNTTMTSTKKPPSCALRGAMTAPQRPRISSPLLPAISGLASRGGQALRVSSGLPCRWRAAQGGARSRGGVTTCVLSPAQWFTVATVGVMPFYALMIGAPKWQWTKKVISSPLPYCAMGLLYGYLLWVSWSPDTLQLMFASEYYFPELKDMALLFSRANTVASAWIHLLAMDLYSARQVYLEGLQHGVTTAHSLVLCCMFAPIGLVCHYITKALTLKRREAKGGEQPIVYSF